MGAALVYLVYHDAISSFEAAKHIGRGTLGGAADSTPTFSIFATFPAPYFGSSMIGPLVDQIVGTAFLLMFVFALTDDRNQPPKSNLAPLLIGFAVAAIGMSFGANAGYAINPARDFGPRVLAWLGGWGTVAFPGAHWYFWVPIVGPLIGGVIGAVVYDLFVGDVLRARGAPPAPDVDAFRRDRGRPAGRRRRARAAARPHRPGPLAAGGDHRLSCRLLRQVGEDGHAQAAAVGAAARVGPGRRGAVAEVDLVVAGVVVQRADLVDGLPGAVAAPAAQPVAPGQHPRDGHRRSLRRAVSSVNYIATR